MTELEQICAEINKLPLPDRLRVAADLFERGLPELAHTIAERAVLELNAALLFRAKSADP